MYRFRLSLSRDLSALSYSSRVPDVDEMQVMWIRLGTAITISFRFLRSKNAKGKRGVEIAGLFLLGLVR